MGSVKPLLMADIMLTPFCPDEKSQLIIVEYLPIENLNRQTVQRNVFINHYGG